MAMIRRRMFTNTEAAEAHREILGIYDEVMDGRDDAAIIGPQVYSTIANMAGQYELTPIGAGAMHVPGGM